MKLGKKLPSPHDRLAGKAQAILFGPNAKVEDGIHKKAIRKASGNSNQTYSLFQKTSLDHY